MAAAQTHQRASRWCTDKPDAKPPNVDAFFFPIVAFELLLLSVEQSLRLLLLLHYGIVRDDTNHNPHVLYRMVKNRSGGKQGIRAEIVNKMNELCQTGAIATVSEKEFANCLKRHDSSYSTFRYFGVDRHGRLSNQWEISPRDVQVLHCLALTLIQLNMDEMAKRGLKAMSSMSRVPGAEMTEDVRELKERLISG